jgi:hypothetical protein
MSLIFIVVLRIQKRLTPKDVAAVKGYYPNPTYILIIPKVTIPNPKSVHNIYVSFFLLVDYVEVKKKSTDLLDLYLSGMAW